MSSTVDVTEISADEIQVEENADGAEQHTYDGDASTNGWDGTMEHSIANDDDDDEDNWSRQVETDDIQIIQRMSSSVTGGETNTIDDDEDGQGVSPVVIGNSDGHEQEHQPVLIPQPRPLTTMKEKLVERERQRRVESERARWKRQFAMAAHAEAENDEDDNINGTSGDANTSGDHAASSAVADHDRSFITDRNSVAGTVGEDTVAPIDTLEDDSNNPNMNYPMERFLQDQHGTAIEGNGNISNPNNSSKNEGQGVVMERFLQEQPTAPANGFVPGAGDSSPHSAGAPLHVDSIPNDSSVGGIMSNELPLLDLPTGDSSTNIIENELPGEPIGDNPFQSPSQQPRVILRLTEAEIQEMAAIEDASRSNAPPSERDDISELGELVSDFGTGLAHVDNQNMSQGTPVTAIESVTSSMGNQIGQVTVLSGSSSDHGGINEIEGHSISSNVVASSAGGDVSLTGNPPSEVARDDDDDAGRILSPRSSQVPIEILPSSPFATVPMVDANMSNNDSGTELELPATNEIIVNRTMRPGLFNYKEQRGDNSLGNLRDRTSANRPIPTNVDNHIEGFDFDKDNFVSSPRGDIVGTRNDLWSPGFSDHSNTLPDYGAMAATEEDVDQDLQRFGAGSRTETIERKTKSEVDDENKPLLGGIPPAVNVTVKSNKRESSRVSLLSIRNMEDLYSLAESIFSDIRSESTATRLSISNEAEDYLDYSVLQRAIPERMLTLIVTLVLEIPTLFFISGGSDKLCNLIGLAKYTTLVALLPVVSAISGNVGLQASALTTRAISHGQVKVENYASWMVKEIGAASYLGRRL